MAFSAVTERGSNNTKTSGTTLAVSPTANLTVGKIVFAQCASDNFALTNGATTEHTQVTDTHTHTWNKVFERTRTAAGVANDGVTHSLWWTKITTQIGTGDSVTFEIANARNVRVIALFEVSITGSTIQVANDGTPQGFHEVGGTSATASTSGMTSQEYLHLGLLGREADVLTWTEDADYTNVYASEGIASSGGGAGTNQSVFAAYRIATLTGDTFAVSWVGSTDVSLALVAFEEVSGTTAVGKEVSLLWDDRFALGDTISPRWDVFAALGDTVQALWDQYTAVGDTVALLWDQTAAVGDTIELVWDVEGSVTAVGDTIALLWDIAAPVGDNLGLVWDQFTTVGDAVALLWDQTAAVGDTVQALWDIRAAIGDSIQLLWDVRPKLYNTFDGGIDGTSLVGFDTGTGSGHAFDDVFVSGGGSVVYDDDGMLASGPFSAKVSAASSPSNAYMEWDSAWGTQKEMYARFYFQTSDATPTTNHDIFRLSEGGTNAMNLQLRTNGTLALRDQSSTLRFSSSTTLSDNAMYRIEIHAKHDPAPYGMVTNEIGVMGHSICGTFIDYYRTLSSRDLVTAINHGGINAEAWGDPNNGGYTAAWAKLDDDEPVGGYRAFWIMLGYAGTTASQAVMEGWVDHIIDRLMTDFPTIEYIWWSPQATYFSTNPGDGDAADLVAIDRWGTNPLGLTEHASASPGEVAASEKSWNVAQYAVNSGQVDAYGPWINLIEEYTDADGRHPSEAPADPVPNGASHGGDVLQAFFDTVHGHMEARIFHGANVHGTTADEQFGDMTTDWDLLGSHDGVRFGLVSNPGQAIDEWFDELAIDNSGAWIGPVAEYAVGKAIALLWDIRGNVGDAIELKWDLFSSIGDAVSLLWDNQEALGDALSLVWDVEALTAIGDEIALLWDVQAPLGDTVQLVWDVRTALGDQVAIQWDINAAIGDLVSLLWDVGGDAIFKTVSLVWDAREASGEDLSFQWDVLNPASQEISMIWDISAAITALLEARWDLQAASGRDLVIRWDNLTTVADQVALSWDIMALLGDSVALVWSSSGPVGDSVELLWDIESTNAVGKSLTLLWFVQQSFDVYQYRLRYRSRENQTRFKSRV